MSRRKAITDAAYVLNKAVQSLEEATDREMGEEVLQLIKEGKEAERRRIGRILGQVANEVFNSQDKEYPSNILDVVRAWLDGWKIGGGHKPIEDWFYSALKKAEEKVG